MYQPKRNHPTTKYLPQTRSPKQNKKHSKIKQIKSKIFKNLNQFPIELTHSTKQNHPHNQAQRPHSSMVSEEGHMHKALKNVRVQSALSQYHEHRDNHNKKRLSLDSTGKRYERDSLASRNSMSKKMSKNTKNLEQHFKGRIAEQRKKSNISCASACDETQHKISKKQSIKQKKPSIGNLHVQLKGKGKENRSPNTKAGEKSRSKSRNRKRKSTVQLDKSKASTTAINTQEKYHVKRKQSTSATQINAFHKKKKKVTKKKSPRNDPQDQFSLEQYPINKYDTVYTTQKVHPFSNSRPANKTRSKSRKGSSSKQARKSSLAEIDYASCINIPSNSSGLINSGNSKESRALNQNIKIIDNWQYRYFEEKTESVDMNEIRYYETYNDSQKKQEREFMERNFRNQDKYTQRRSIQDEIMNQYPQFGDLQLKFLSSVIFIQRKWKQYKLYREVFRNLTQSRTKISQYSLEQSNSKQLNISFHPKSPEKTSQKGKKMYQQRSEKEENSPQIKRQLFSPQRESSSPEQKPYMKHNLYLNYREVGDDEQISNSEHMSSHRMEENLSSQKQLSNLSLSNHNYQFLSNQLFPSMNYISVKLAQLKQKLQGQHKHLSDLERKGAITYKQYLKLKSQAELQYSVDVTDLNRSRKHLKKGYLSFIDTFKDIKQESGLRRVSSENGPMAILYCKVYNLDKTVKNSSQSSQSMKRLSKRVLIRKEFFQTQKIESNVFNSTIQKTQSARQRNQKKEHPSLSARITQKSKMSSERQEELDQGLAVNRIKEGLLISPELYKVFPKIQPKSPQQSQEQTQSLILEDIIAKLTHELFSELVRIDEAREAAIDILIEQQQSVSTVNIKASQIQEFEVISETDSVELESGQKEDDFEIVEEFKFRQIFKIEGLADRPQIIVNRKHRNFPHLQHISPASAELIPFQSEEIIAYAKELFGFFQDGAIMLQIVEKLNKNQGFTPKQYLKFLRDFQIPDEEYDPLISNEIFIHWEDTYYKNKILPSEEEPYSKRQAITIFHRCIFECLIGILEDNRPSGDKGQPFPWQNTVFFKRELSIKNLPELFQKTLSALDRTIANKCGLIEEKQLIFSEDDMERFHEQNEDRIITMLEQELQKSPDSWYQIEEHGLQIKLEVQQEVYEYIMLEALDEILEIL